MDIKKLRQKLLDLAIRGELVPQDPNDEPASELLSRIHEEKLAMVERGELKPKDVKNDTVIYFGSDGLPYEKRADGEGKAKCIESEIPFELPEGWGWARVASISDEPSYGTSKKSDIEGTVPVLRMGNITRAGTIDYSNLVYTSDADDIAKYDLHPGDLIFNRTNSREWVGKVAYYDGSIPAIYAGYLIRFRAILINPKYINYAMCTQYERNWCASVKTDGVNQSNINARKLKSFLIPVPPLAEQLRIVDALDKYLALVDGIERDRADLDGLLAQLKSKVLDLAVRGELVEHDPGDEPASELLSRIREEKLAMVGRGELKPKDVKNDTVIFTGSDGLRYEKPADGKAEAKCIEGEIPFEIPEGWSWARLSTLCLPQERRLPSGERFNYIDIGSIDNSRNLICSNEIDTANAPSRASRCVHAGSIVFSMVRPYLRNIAQVPVSMKDSVASTGFYVATKACNVLDEYFLFQLLLSDYAVNSINLHMKGDNSPSVRKEDMDALLLPIPPLDEQRRIVKRAKEVFNLLD